MSATTTHARPSQPWTRRDLMMVAGLAAVAAVAIGLGTIGLTRVQPVAGLALILTLAYCLSSARQAIDYRTVGWGLGLQFLFAIVVLKTSVGQLVFQTAGAYITKLLDFAYVGSSFVFGPLGNRDVWPRIMTDVLGQEGGQYANVFAFMVLPTIIFIAALFAMLYYFGVMQFVVRVFAVVMRRFMRASGAESLNVAASIFMGQTEAPLTIRPFLPRMTESELMTVMTAGMAHISGGVMAAYIIFGAKARAPPDGGHHDGARHVDDGQAVRAGNRPAGDHGHGEARGGEDRRQRHRRHRSRHRRRTAPGAQRRRHADLLSRDRGAGERHARPGRAEHAADSRVWVRAHRLEPGRAVGRCADGRQPARHAHGAQRVRRLLAARPAARRRSIPKSFTIATFALCGFANFSSIGIQIGGIGALAPERRHDLARLGLRAMLAGTFANFLTATIAGMLL